MSKNVIGDFISAAILTSGKSQSQIAEEVGYTAHNNISMIKSGKMLFPPEKITPFAKALNIDEALLFRIVMQSRYPEVFAIYERHAEILTNDEKRVIDAYRAAKGSSVDEDVSRIKSEAAVKAIEESLKS